MNVLSKSSTLVFLSVLAACNEPGSVVPGAAPFSTAPSTSESSAALAPMSASIFDQQVPESMSELQSIDQVAEAYTRLVLTLGNHDGNYVDAYYGPPEWAEQAKQNEAAPAAIATTAEELRQALAAQALPEDAMLRLRKHYLDRQLLAVAAHARALSNGKSSFSEQTRTLYDTETPRRELGSFEAIIAELDSLVPGEGDLRDRLDKYRAQFVIPADRLQAVFERAIAECRARTEPYIKLPAHENFTMEFVTGQPWSGYNWYKGDAYSLIQINTDLPIYITRAVDLGCHEGYPGHHAYNALLEENLVRQRGWTEFSVYPLFSPQSLIAEGSANYGIELAFPGQEKMEFERDVLYPLAGLDSALAPDYSRILALMGELSYAGNEVARQYLDGEIDAAQAARLLQHYGLSSEAAAEQRVRFFDTYGAYVINYNWGQDLVRDYIEQTENHEERWRRFRELISSPRVPSSLSL